jgi:hypothetical protein
MKKFFRRKTVSFFLLSCRMHFSFLIFYLFFFHFLGIARAATSRPDLPQIIPLLGILHEFGVTWTDLYLRIPIVVRYVIFRTFSLLSEALSSAPLPLIPSSLPLLGISDEGSAGRECESEREIRMQVLHEGSVEVVTKSHKNINNINENVKNENIGNIGNNEIRNNKSENLEIPFINMLKNDCDEKDARVRSKDGGEGSGSNNIENEDRSVVDTDNNNDNIMINKCVIQGNGLDTGDKTYGDEKNVINNIGDHANAVTSDQPPTLLESVSTSVSTSTSPSVSSSQSSILALLRVMVKMRATRDMIGDKAIMKIAETINLVLNSYEFTTSFSTSANSETSKSYQNLSIMVKTMIASSAKSKKVPIVLSSVKSTENIPIPFILPKIAILDKNDRTSVNAEMVTNNLREFSDEEIEKNENSEDGTEREGTGREGNRGVREGEGGREGDEKLFEGCWAEGMCDALTLLLEQ